MSFRFEVDLARPNGFRLQLDLKLDEPKMVAIFGQSGCGKTTLLRTIAGLEKHAKANIHINGQVWQDHQQRIPTYQRSLGFVFQQTQLFEHLSVLENIQFSLRHAGHRQVVRGQAVDQPFNQQRNQRDLFDELVELLNLQTLLPRRTHQLSGGEQQRVALARALVSYPQLLLLDEPLSGAHQSLKLAVLQFLRRLHEQHRMTMLYVTHSISEVVMLADWLVVIDEGRLISQGKPAELLNRLHIPLIQTLIQTVPVSIVTVEWVNYVQRYQLLTVKLAGVQLALICDNLHQHPDLFDQSEKSDKSDKSDRSLVRRLRLQIHAQDVHISRLPLTQSSITGNVPVSINDMHIHDDIHIHDDKASHPVSTAWVMLRLCAHDTSLLCRISRQVVDDWHLCIGDRVYAHINKATLISAL